MHRHTTSPLALSALLATLLLSSGARAQDGADSWLGPDKALHFSLSAALAGGGYALGSAYFDTPTQRLMIGGGLALGLGVAKELYDLTGAGQPSWKDLAWDVLGTLTGLAIAWTIDQLFFTPRPYPSGPLAFPAQPARYGPSHR